MRNLRKFIRSFALFMSVNLLIQLMLPSVAWALTGGPSQPETQQFAPAGMDNMVDPFTGDFSYNIPLMDVGGYPININYAAGITPDAEASWVGLGWNLNVGSVNRSVRGLPDDFAGDEVTKDFDIKPNQTYGVSGKVDFEIFGAKLKTKKAKASLGLSANLFYNNYNGFGMSMGVSPSVSAGLGSKGKYTGSLGLSASLGSESGLEITPTAGIKSKQQEGDVNTTMGATIGFPFSTREGLKGMSLSGSFSQTTDSKYDALKNKWKETSYSGENLGGGGTSAFQGFASPTYSPSLEHNSYNINASLNISFSPTNPATENPAFGFGGYYSGQFLKGTSRSTPSYGYMYSGLTQTEDKVLDFNREKDGGFNKFTTNLAVTNFTYDIYSLSGQGVGGTYRPYRSDVGAVHDPVTSDQGYSPRLGVDIGIGTPPSAKIGVDAEFNYTQSFSGKWPDNRSSITNFKNPSVATNNPNKETAYFKKIGEPAPEDDSYFLNDVQKGYNTVQHSISPGGGGFLNGKYSVQNTGASETVNTDNQRRKRRVRTTSFTTLTAKEAANSAILPIENYSANDFTWQGKNDPNRSPDLANQNRGYVKTTIPRVGNGKKEHHVSEIRATDGSGARYIYGLPVYNTKQEEVTFAIPGGNGNAATGIATYTPGADDVASNKNGIDNYFNKVSTPEYATSHLLTCVLSADYVDSDGIDGPSDGDLGTYTKFNYTRLTDNFQWRSPFENASFSEGMTGVSTDDKANYVYGVKEIWYLHSIETRTHVAEFYMTNRDDARGVASRHGGIGGPNLKKLDRIELYSKPDKWNSEGEPLKTVYFDYDYLLSPNTPNSIAKSIDNTISGGKLTLKKIWFTYGKSKKGLLNPYVFNYADQNFDGTMDAGLNPSYSIRNYDRWSNYKPDDGSSGFSNAEFPYSEQRKNLSDKYVAAYNLSSIQTPTGGTMRVYYESDDYAYVQNKRAMRMFKVLGAAESSTKANPTGELYGNIMNLVQRNWLIVDLGEGFTPTTADPEAEFKQKYLEGIDLMYYKFMMNVLGGVNDRDEYVPGYAQIATAELRNEDKVGNTYKRAAIQLRNVDIKNGKAGPLIGINPIVRNGWMFARLHLSREMMGSGNSSDNGLEQALRALLSMSSSIAKLFTGFPVYMAGNQNSATFDPNKSFIRLNEPDKIKMGGGHRVKAIVMVDNWGQMKGSQETGTPLKQTSYYGQSYDYSFDENGKTISAGVAAYEPMLGGEENPFRLPVFVREKVPLAPSKEYYLEEPFGESFFPAPVVGYRKVVVKPIKITNGTLDLANLQGNGTGLVEHGFYTSFDFPSITSRTGIQMDRHKPNILFKFMKFDSRDLVTCSQGYYVELNDMHGKQRSQRVYPEYTEDPNNLGKPLAITKPISEVEYTYRLNPNGTLNNKVPLVNRDFTVSSGANAIELGVDVDMVQDERFFETTTLGGGLQLNLKYVQAAVVPLTIPTAFPDFNSEQTRFRSIVTTKVVNKYGLLEKTTAKDNGTSITTSNLAWDGKTGQVLLTKVDNEYHDPIYNFTIPGHWAYSRLDIASKNEGNVFTTLSNAALTDGDELATPSGVYHLVKNGSSSFLYDKVGNSPSTLPTPMKVVRSGARNMPGTPVGSISTLDNPIQANGTLQFSKILNAGATEFKEEWNRFCNCPKTIEDELLSNANVFAKGLRGNLRPLRSWTYLTERTQSKLNNNVNVRKDGYFTNFNPFWSYSNGYIRPAANIGLTRWQYVTEIQNYNPVGMEIENKDALGRYSMAQFGYGRNLPAATSNNSKYRSTGYDGFEDYDYTDCQDDHFSWRTEHATKVTTDEAHTGRKSIKVSKNDGSVKINKVIVECEDPVGLD